MDPVIDLYRNQNQTVIDAFDQIVVNIFMQKEKQQHKSFVICGCNPGAGTTSTAVELAISLSVAGWRTVLVDADLRKENQYKRLNEKAKAGLSEYIADHVSAEEILCRTNWPGLDYIACGKNRKETPVKLLCSIRMGELMERLNQDYDFILFDVPSLNTAVDAKILASKVDCTFLVVESGVTTFQNLSEAKRQMEEVEANVVGVIANKLPMEEYRKVVKDYNYFRDKGYARRRRANDKKGERNQSKRSGLLKGFLGCLLFIMFLSGVYRTELVYGAPGSIGETDETYSQSGSIGMMPVLMVSGYTIEEGNIEAGENFTLNIQMRNENRYVGAYQVSMTLYSQTDGVYLQPGETNQRYIEYVPPGGTGSFQIRMAVSEQVESDKAIMEIRFDYVNENGSSGANTTAISPQLKADTKLEIIALTAADQVELGARALLNIRYANAGETEVQDVRLKIEGNIEDEQKQASVDTPEIGQQKYLDWYVVFTEPGSQRLSVSLTYKDEKGNFYELEPERVTVLVMDREIVAAEDENSAILSSQNGEAEIVVSSDSTKGLVSSQIVAGVGACALVIVLVTLGLFLQKQNGICLISLRTHRKKKGDLNGTAENRGD